MKKSIFFEFCTVKTLEKQYPHYTGTEKWMIISDLSKEELEFRFPTMMKRYRPYLIVTTKIGKAIRMYEKNERKHQRRRERHFDIFGYVDGRTECVHREVREDDCETIFFNKVEKRERRMELQKALQLLTKKQQRRILMYYFDRKTEREIANILHVSKSAVHDSLAAGMKKLRDFYDGKEIFWDCF